MPQSDSGEETPRSVSIGFTLQQNHSSEKPRVYVLLLRQDDPRRCTSAKLAKFRLAKPLYKPRQIPRKSLVLNPFASKLLLPSDSQLAAQYGLVAVDCSWERVHEVLSGSMPGSGRKLPALLASNPVNYAKLGRLSSVEALAAALHIMGYKEKARQLLSLFKWGETFLTLNQQPLESYSTATSSAEMLAAEAQFF